MSGLPPVIDSAQPGTPSSEWARSTTTAALGRTEPAPAFSTTNDNTSIPSTTGGVSVSSANDAQKGTFDAKTYHVAPTTPGSEFPGAYPPTPGERAGGPISADSVRETATNAATTAQSAAATAGGYIQSAATTAAGYLPQGVVDTVTSYMPSSTTTSTMTTARASEHDTEHKTSFPTREFSGASTGERTGGVGSLPGPLNEAAVTKLPHERVDEEKYMTAAAAATALAAGAYAAKDRIANALPSAQDAYDAKDRAVNSLPSTQSASQTLSQISQNTAQTVKQAAPTIPGLSSSTPHSTAVTAPTVPSHELVGAQPGDHSSGAGLLPGLSSEPHVARLPEESANPQYDSGPMDTGAQAALKPSQERFGNESATGDMRRVGGVGALVGDRDESGVALAPDERAGIAASTTGASRTLPSQEPLGNEATGAPKTVGGVGALPGNFNESGVAVLPDARASTGTGTGTVTSPKVSTPAPAIPPKDEQKSADNGGEKNLKNATGGTHGKPNEGPAYDTNYHPADLHPAPTNPTSTSTSDKADDESRPTESRHSSAVPDSPSSTASPATKAKKAGFMDKMRGEAKVLLGRMEHNPGKVEAGQRQKAGEA